MCLSVPRFITFVLATLGIVAMPGAWAQNREAGPQRFATDDFKPYIDFTQPGGGYYPTLIREVLAEQGVTVEFVKRPWQRAHLETAQGRFDASFPYLRTPERERDFLYSDPLLRVSSYLYVRAVHSGADPAVLIERARHTCYLQDSMLPPLIQARISRGALSVTRVRDIGQCFQMLVAGRIDYVAAGQFNANATLRALYGESVPVVAIGQPLDDATLHLVWPRRDPRSAARQIAFNRALARLQAKGRVQQLQQAMLPQPGVR